VTLFHRRRLDEKEHAVRRAEVAAEEERLTMLRGLNEMKEGLATQVREIERGQSRWDGQKAEMDAWRDFLTKREEEIAKQAQLVEQEKRQCIKLRQEAEKERREIEAQRVLLEKERESVERKKQEASQLEIHAEEELRMVQETMKAAEERLNIASLKEETVGRLLTFRD